MAAMDPIYNTRILALAADIPFLGPLADAEVEVTATSRICGSRLRLWACFAPDGTALARVGLVVKACALGQAATALIMPKLIGMPEAEISRARASFAAMLKGDGPVPDVPFAELELFLPVRDLPARQGAVMLPFDAAMKAFAARRERQAAGRVSA